MKTTLTKRQEIKNNKDQIKKKYHKFGLGDENKNKWRLHMKKNKKNKKNKK